jgi:SAM-dependent MidA family methyltransferase
MLLSLGDRLRDRIRQQGPITFCDWMRAALYDENEGYYRRTDRLRWGREGDYRTSPELSPLFSATFARYFARLHEEGGSPPEWTILEVGAGDGRFAKGVLQTLQTSFHSAFAATRYTIDEVSSSSKSLAQERLVSFGDRVEFRSMATVEINPGILFSNELLDAFPVHRVIMREGRLQEFYVTLGLDEEFEWKLEAPSTTALADYLEQAQIDLAEGQVTEINLEIEPWLTMAAGLMQTGYLIAVDYGEGAAELHSARARPEGSLRGFYQHRMVDNILARPGEQDLTTTIDWSFVKRSAEAAGFEVVEFERQDQFLLAAGILEQLETELRKQATDADKLRLTTAAREMILPTGMAGHFQVLVLKKGS